MLTMRRLTVRPAAAAVILAALLSGTSPAIPARQQPAPLISTAPAGQAGAQSTDAKLLRTLTVTVIDAKGGYVTGLQPSDFTVYDGKEPRKIVSFGADAPASVGIVLDVSASMFLRGINEVRSGKSLQHLKDALKRFLEESNPSNEYFLIGFNNSPQLLLDKTSDREAVLAAVDRLGEVKFKGQTAFYDACYLALHKASSGQHQKRSLVVISDGMDNASKYSYQDLTRALKESDVSLYPVADSGKEDSYFAAGRAILDELAKTSGGFSYYLLDPKDLTPILTHLAAGLRNQYSIGVDLKPSARKDGWHDLRVKVDEARDPKGKTVKLFTRTRKGLYAQPDRP